MNSHEHDEAIAHTLWSTCVLSHERKATFTFLFEKFQKVIDRGIAQIQWIFIVCYIILW